MLDAPTRVGDRSWAFVRSGGWGEANALLSVGDGESVLVDTPWDTRVRDALFAHLGRLTTDAPVRHVVNTHADGDHWWGNDAAPTEAVITTSGAALEQMRDEPGPREIGVMTSAGRLTGRLPGRVGRASRYLCCIFAGVERPTTTRLPDSTFTGSTTLVVGGLTVDLVDDGPAHTAGDVVAHVTDDGVVAAGDLLFVGSTPLLWHGPLENWTRALERMLGTGAEVFVPGHGPLSGPDEVRSVLEYWRWVEAAGRSHHDAGRPVLEAARRMLASEDSRPWRAWSHPDRLAVSLHTLWALWGGGTPHPPTVTDRLRAFSDAELLSRA